MTATLVHPGTALRRRRFSAPLGRSLHQAAMALSLIHI